MSDKHCSHHFPAKVVPSRPHAGFKSLPVHVGWKRKIRPLKADKIATGALCVLCFPLIKLSEWRNVVLLLYSMLLVLTSDLLPDLHSCSSSPSHWDAAVLCIVLPVQERRPFILWLSQGNFSKIYLFPCLHVKI